MKHILLTPAGVERLRARLAQARAAYKAVCDDNPAAAESGDSSVWHDNFAFEENQRQMHMLARLVRDLESRLLSVSVADLRVDPSGEAVVGSCVTWRFVGEPRTRRSLLAGYEDGDPACNRLSYNSPLGSALIGACVGDEVEAELGNGTGRRIQVLSIEAATPQEDSCAVD